MAQDIPAEIIERVRGAGWLVPTPHEPFAEGGGAHVYLCYARELVAALESFVRAAGPMAGMFRFMVVARWFAVRRSPMNRSW